MSNIENRTVQMQFDNATFEQRISSTMASLSKLQKSLDFANANKNLSELSTTGKNFSLGGMASAIEGVSGKFVALATIGITALSNITNKAVDAGLRIAKSLTLQPVLEGFREYETNMNSIQTVLANTRSDGTTLQNVNDALEELNRYSDQTIYNFGEMARNIGTFTAAGVSLDSSTAAIKGIANLAAVSGSNSQQASSAMYQLSQALATGTLRLIDWNSVVNAGMGGEVFQRALYETGKAMKTIETGDVDQTFEEWTKSVGSFRDSLESGWITAEVLTTTLQGFTGDMDAAQLAALGFTEAQAAEIIEMGKVAKAAATEVKTLTQLRGTIQESVASGWSQSFKLIVGDFEEAKALFTEINDVVGGIVGRSADSRNLLLAEWKFLGGRTVLIDGVRNAFQALGDVLAPIQRAFRDIFPKTTSFELLEMTERFRDFTESLKPSVGTITNIRKIFQGIFAGLEIGWTVLKETAKFFIGLFKSMVPGGSGGKILDFFGDIGVKINDLNKVLVEGGGIKNFFDDLPGKIKKFTDKLDFSKLDPVITKLKDFKTTLKDFVDGFKPESFDSVKESVTGLGTEFGWLAGISDILTGAWDKVKDKFSGIGDVLSEFAGNIKENFGNVGQAIADAISTDDFGPVGEALELGLVGAIILFVRKLTKSLDFDFAKDFLKGVSGSMEELTGVLSAMQTKLKAEALEKIAISIGILAGSLLVLSLIDPDKLGQALGAMALGFGQLIGAFALLNQITAGPASAAKVTATAGGLILMATAVGILSIAIGGLAQLEWDELARGLTGVVVAIGALSLAVIPLSKNSPGMVRAGIGMILVGTALNIIALAVKQFSLMDWGEIGKGLAGVAGGLAAVTLAMNLMPKGMALKSVGVLLVSVALNALALAVKQFGKMDWGELGKGLLGVGGGLLLIAGAMNLMPLSLPITAAGLLLVSLALGKIADAVKSMAEMSWTELARGLTGLGGALLILAGATTLMAGAIPGAIAIGLVALSLGKLHPVIKEFSKFKWGELLKGLGALALTLGTLGLSAVVLAPAIPVMLALGAALILIGGGLTLIGAGAYLAAEAFNIIARLGGDAIAAIAGVIGLVISKIPEFLLALAEGITGAIRTILEASPEFVAAGVVVVKELLKAVPQIAPALGEALVVLIQTGLAAIRAVFPDIVKTGMEMLLALLHGIEDNIVEITETVIQIIVKFVNTLAENMDQIVEAGVNLVIALAKAILGQLWRLVQAGWDSVKEYIKGIGEWLKNLPAAGLRMVVDLIKGITQGFLLMPVVAAGTILAFTKKLGEMALDLAKAGGKIIVDLANGIKSAVEATAEFFAELGRKIAKWITDAIINAIPSAAGAIADAITDIMPDLDFLGSGDAFNDAVREAQEEQQNNNPDPPQPVRPVTASSFLGSNQLEMPVKFDMSSTQIKPLAIEQSVAEAQSISVGTQTMIDLLAEIKEVLENQPVRDVTFEQNVYSPEPISTATMYRQTKSQIALAKEELKI